MYRLVLYYLIALLVAALGLSIFGILQYSPLDILLSSLFLVAVCQLANEIFAWAFKAPINFESAYITALILALIITPSTTLHGMVFLGVAGLIAMASKYMFTIGGRHIFNPAAVAVLLTSLAGGDNASWWVGSLTLLPFVIIGGLLVMHKTRRSFMVLGFIASALVATTVYSLLAGSLPAFNLQRMLVSSALFFLAFVMLTEPLTSPTTHKEQGWYGMLVGVLFPPQVHVGAIFSTPELVLLIGNFFAYFASSQSRIMPTFVRATEIAPSTYDIVFKPNRRLKFQPGQYMEWTLPHKHSDSRGTRRFFTLASSPTESELHLGVKFYPNSSTYKRALATISAATPIAAGQLGGDFVLPRNPHRKLVFIAGGIGVTPYRSIIKYLLDNNQTRPITMLYAARNGKNVVYSDIFEEARTKIGLKIIYALSDSTAQYATPFVRHGNVSAELIQQEIPDYLKRLFYVSGPPAMVSSITHSLRQLGVHSRNIKTDLFSGY